MTEHWPPFEDVLNALVRLSEADRPFGIQAEVLRMISNLVVMLDERFLVHTGVHKAVIRLLQACMGDEITEFDVGTGKAMGAAGSVARLSPSEYEEDCTFLKYLHPPSLTFGLQWSTYSAFSAVESERIPNSS